MNDILLNRRREMMQGSDIEPNLIIDIPNSTTVHFGNSVKTVRIDADVIKIQSGGEAIIFNTTITGTYTLDAGSKIEAFNCTLFYAYDNQATAVGDVYCKDIQTISFKSGSSATLNVSGIIHIEDCGLTTFTQYLGGINFLEIINCSNITSIANDYGKCKGLLVEDCPSMNKAYVYDYYSPYCQHLIFRRCGISIFKRNGYPYNGYSAVKTLLFEDCPNIRTIQYGGYSFTHDNDAGMLDFANSLPQIPAGETGICTLNSAVSAAARVIIEGKGWTLTNG